MFKKCRVTVVKKACSRELADSYVQQPEKVCICDQVKENQQFMISNPYQIPEGICAWAWADIRHHILAVASGSTFEFLKDKHSAIAACSDLFRPVTFKIERLSD